MSDRIKVAGYSQKVTYTDGIEYRNFSPDLVGLQLASNGGTPLFSMGNFSVTTNFDPKKTKFFTTSKFSNFITLSDLDLTLESSLSLLTNNAGVILNLDKRNLTNYALFNSLREFVRVALENVITTWPAALYVTPIFDSEEFDTTQSGLTVQNYYYDSLTNKSSFRVNTNVLNNPFQINFKQNGTLKDTFNQENDIRNIVLNYASYSILFNNVEADVLEFTGSNTTNEYIYFVVNGNIFTGFTDGYVSYHIKPNKTNENLFFNNLPKFEKYLLNRLTNPKYTALFNYSIRSDSGDLLYVTKNLTWPVSDGYNIDFDTDAYLEYVTSLLEISDGFDSATSNLMVRFLVTESITDFDTTNVHLDPLQEDTSGQKMNKTLTIYGVEFDKINNFISGIKFANTVSYDKNNNTPDIYLKNLARVLGWDLISSVLENNLLKSYIEPKESSYSGQSVGLTPIEADVELWRRIILNTPWIWKSKGTRKSIEFLFKFIGTPLGLISFNEYVYLAENKIDIDVFREALRLNGFLDDISQYPISVSGYPQPLPNTSDNYFQGNGLWYRETGGDNASLDITSGNNPHVGPYDGGYKYINQFRELIPNFSAVTISSETITTSTKNLFTNYNLGKMTTYSGNTYVDITDESGADFSNCFVVDTTIIQDPKNRKDETDCGCQNPSELQALSICIDKNSIQTSSCQDEIAGYTITEPENYYIFDINQYNIDGSQYTLNGVPVYHKTKFINKECCNINGSKPYFYNEYGVDFTDVVTPLHINSGYICCKASNTCGCLVTCKWDYANETYTHSSEKYLVFNNELNEKIVTSEDGCNCVSNYTVPVLITDPYTNTIGYGCQLTEAGLEDLNKPVSIIKKTYYERSRGIIGCSSVPLNETISKVFVVTLNDVSSVGKSTTNFSYNVIGGQPTVQSYSYSNTNIPINDSPVGYLSTFNNSQPLPEDGNVIRMIVQGQTSLPANLPFDPIKNKMFYLQSDFEFTGIDDLITAIPNMVEVSPIEMSRGGQYYGDFIYQSIGNETYTYLIFDYRGVEEEPNYTYRISYTNNIATQPIQLLIGNNSTTPSIKLYEGLYSSDPIVGTHSSLPAVNATIVLGLNGGPNIIAATCNGVTINPNSSYATWNNVNGSVDVSFTTNTPIAVGNGYPLMVALAVSIGFICDAPEIMVYVSQNDADAIIRSGILRAGTTLYKDIALTEPVLNFNFVKYLNGESNYLDSQSGVVLRATNKTC